MTGRQFGSILIMGVVAQAIVLAAVLISVGQGKASDDRRDRRDVVTRSTDFYAGQLLQVRNVRGGCERGKLDRADNARVAGAVLRGFRETDHKQPGPRTGKRTKAERDLSKARAGLKERADIDCVVKFPDPPRSRFVDEKRAAEIVRSVENR